VVRLEEIALIREFGVIMDVISLCPGEKKMFLRFGGGR